MLHRYELLHEEQAELIRTVRNNARQFMTRDTAYITHEDQVRWFTRYQDDINQHLYIYHEDDALVGYTYLVLRNGLWWGTLVVVPEQQGKGYGTKLYKEMIRLAHVVYIEIYSDNEHSLKSAVKAGFHIVSVMDNILVFRGTIHDTAL